MSATLRLALGRNLPDGQECLQPGGVSGNALIFISHINRRFAGGTCAVRFSNKGGGGRMQCDQKPMM